MHDSIHNRYPSPFTVVADGTQLSLRVTARCDFSPWASCLATPENDANDRRDHCYVLAHQSEQISIRADQKPPNHHICDSLRSFVLIREMKKAMATNCNLRVSANSRKPPSGQ
jgi:hypothetical protein